MQLLTSIKSLFKPSHPSSLEDSKVFEEAMKRVDEYEKNWELSQAELAMKELVRKYEEALERAEPALRKIEGRQDISPDKLQELTEKISWVRKRYQSAKDRLIEVSNKIDSFRTYAFPDAVSISGYPEAIGYIKKLNSKKEFDLANRAVHELLLKHRSALGFADALVKKLRTFEATNILEVSNKAKSRIDSTLKVIGDLDARVSELEKWKFSIEYSIQKEELARASEEDKERFRNDITLVEWYIKQGKHLLAIGNARKLLAENPNNSQAVKLFKKAEKQFAEYLKKEKNNHDKKNSADALLEEAGINVLDTTEKKEGSFFVVASTLLLARQEIAKWIFSRREEGKRKKALSDIEKLLRKSKGLDKLDIGSSNFSNQFTAAKAGFIRDLSNFRLPGFDFYGKIIGKDEVTGDTFGFHRYDKEGRTVFYLGDATGHGIQASFTVAMTSKIFFDITSKTKEIREIAAWVNNELKKSIQWRYFLTGIFFEWLERERKLRFIGGGHDPIYHYHKNTRTVEKIIPGNLAIGVRIINNPESIKIREIEFDDGDILFAYTDGVIECRDTDNVAYWLERLEKAIEKWAKSTKGPKEFYEFLTKELEIFRKGREFDDDVSMYIFMRNETKDVVYDKEEIRMLLESVKWMEWTNKFGGDLKNRTREQIAADIARQRKNAELSVRLSRLQQLFELWEFYKLKQEIVRYFKDGFADPKMKYYLEQTIKNEQVFALKRQDDRITRRYNTLLELYKKWQYDVVIREALDVIAKNGKI